MCSSKRSSCFGFTLLIGCQKKFVSTKLLRRGLANVSLLYSKVFAKHWFCVVVFNTKATTKNCVWQMWLNSNRKGLKTMRWERELHEKNATEKKNNYETENVFHYMQTSTQILMHIKHNVWVAQKFGTLTLDTQKRREREKNEKKILFRVSLTSSGVSSLIF